MIRVSIALLLLPAMLLGQEAEFRPAAIAGHMKFLASDLLEGRAAATRGYDLAAAYVAAQLEAAGVAPGAGDSYMQVVPFRKTLPAEQSAITIERERGAPLLLRFGEDFLSAGDPLHEDRRVTGRLTVVGYGVTAPELGHDDYAAIDARGKIVVIFSGAPARFDPTLRAHYSSSIGKIENAAAHGAAGVMIVDTRVAADRTPWSSGVRHARMGAMHWIDAAGAPQPVNTQISHTITLHPDVFETLLAESSRSIDVIRTALDGGMFRSFDLPLRASIRLVSAHERTESPNVVGLVRGSDPKLREQYLVYSSHLDHVGVTEPVDGDAIHNGAFDNASGIAALLEIARAIAAMNPPPRRSVLFVATTAEEKGLRGADYFAAHPTVPAEAIVANINIDQIMMIEPVTDVIVHGIENSTLGAAARAAARKSGIGISPDPAPEEVVFVRSDQYAFIRRGIPALYIDAGYVSPDPAADPRASRQQWVKSRYHTPKDDLEQQLDFSIPAMVARFAWLAGVEAANADAAPAWLPGDFFERTFGSRRR